MSAEKPISVNGSSVSGGKSSVPDTLADRTAWMNMSKGKLNKYAHRYARKESEVGGGSVGGDTESVAGGAEGREGGGWGAETDSTVAETADKPAAVETW